jgi:hypothetical protein
MYFSSYFRINFKAQLNERYYVPSNFGFECIGFSLDSILSSCYFSSFALFYLLLIVLRYLLYSSYISLICNLSLMQIFLCLILYSQIIFHRLFVKYLSFYFRSCFLHFFLLLFYHFILSNLILIIHFQYFRL